MQENVLFVSLLIAAIFKENTILFYHKITLKRTLKLFFCWCFTLIIKIIGSNSAL